MDNFDLKKYLVENKATTNSRLVEREDKKSKILNMSQDELKDVYGTLQVKGEYLGKKGTFTHFKKSFMGDVICNFRTDDATPSGLRRTTQAIKVKSDDVKFD